MQGHGSEGPGTSPGSPKGRSGLLYFSSLHELEFEYRAGGQGVFLFLSFFFCILGPHPQHMEVARLEIKSEL